MFLPQSLYFPSPILTCFFTNPYIFLPNPYIFPSPIFIFSFPNPYSFLPQSLYFPSPILTCSFPNLYIFLPQSWHVSSPILTYFLPQSLYFPSLIFTPSFPILAPSFPILGHSFHRRLGPLFDMLWWRTCRAQSKGGRRPANAPLPRLLTRSPAGGQAQGSGHLKDTLNAMFREGIIRVYAFGWGANEVISRYTRR